MAQQCFKCHSMRGVLAEGAPVVRTQTSGPDLTHVASRTTLFADLRDFSVEHLKEWLRDPRSMKAGVRMPGAKPKDPSAYPSVADDAVRGIDSKLNLDADLLDKVANYLAALK